jgi:RNA polymerase-binding transcription factor DksA
MKSQEYEKYKAILLTLRSRVRGDVDQLTREALTGHDGSSGQHSPTHLAELGSDNYEQEFALQFVENDQEVLGEISAALDRIEAGTFGLCELCLTGGKSKSKAAIPKSRLNAIPYARNCIECERKREEFST